ncbi:DUF2130 domain-containing protein [Weissella ceti]|uniref:DUF2130 domain-containing protein n=1 Tax=Weissella ceti TaxID=759620 RepID=A0ABT3E584_9LACO|nr:DUF2130 domain-containing protein [Weissella ceti]MCW0953566.1 DUF2130 domain-containing protein [Weissella ceti]QVK12213.1 DUF2130 domain-containing protein [Weissella ceti]
MAKVKFHIQSQHELVLDQDAKEGDVIDLTEEQNIDTSVISKNIQEMVEAQSKKDQAEWQKQQDVLTKERLAAELTKAEAGHASELSKREQEVEVLKAKLLSAEEATDTAVKTKLMEQEAAQQKALNEQAQQIAELKAELKTQALEKDSEKQQALADSAKKVTELEGKLQFKDQEKELAKKEVESKFAVQLEKANEQVEFYRDFKARQSTKDIGESLEQYALNEFNKIRMSAYPNAYFEKDNEVSKASGSKGDFIFRDYADGMEYISIMFDMKNEADETVAKKPNSAFFKELDKDRREKGTEYAVLVSMLEADSDFYNTGIVQVYEYEKMYVVRPQFFIQLIGILRNAALNSIEYKRELETVKEQNIDISNFESELQAFKDNFGITATRFNGNLEKLDKNLEDSIKKLETARDELRKAMKNLGTAENKIDKVDIKKLTKNNPTMAAKFEELNSQQ